MMNGWRSYLKVLYLLLAIVAIYIGTVLHFSGISGLIIFTGPINFMKIHVVPKKQHGAVPSVGVITPTAGVIPPVRIPEEEEDETILKYQKCKYPTIDPFDPVSLSYHRNPDKFRCDAKRYSIVEEEVLRVEITGIKEAWLYYIIRVADSKSELSKAIPVYVNGHMPPDAEGRLLQKPCFVECGGHGGPCLDYCGHNGYCCQKNHTDCPANIAKGAPVDVYGCTKEKGTYIYYRVNQPFVKLKLTNTAGKTWDEYHHAFLKPPNTENNVNDRTNIIMLHLDGCSDANVKRQLKKTYAYLKTHKHTVMFNQHSIIGDGTTENMSGMLAGHLITELSDGRKGVPSGKVVDDWPFIWKDMHKLKYETWFTEEFGPKGGAFHYRLRGFNKPPVKHYYRPLWMILDPIMGKKPLCGAKFNLENVKQYFKTYRNYNKYSLVMFNFLSHDYPSWISNVDDLLLDLYKDLEKDGYMNNTVIILYGDHGNRASGFRSTFQGKLEERFPFLGITVPPWFEKHKELMKNLRRNKDVLTTHFDTYSTLQHIMTFPHTNSKTTTRKGTSYFGTDLRKLNRTCPDVSIKPHFCLCLNMFENVNTDNLAAKQAVEKIVAYMNKENEKHAKGYCAKLSLKTFVNAEKQKGLRGVTGYRVKFVTSPSNGLYEASVTCDGGGKDITTCGAPEISRTNLYGSQPECIRDIAPRLAKHCYCKDYKGKS